MTAAPPPDQFDPTRWRTASASGANGGCVEINDSVPGVIGMRDSKFGDKSPVAVFDVQQWDSWLTEVETSQITGRNGIVRVTEHAEGWNVYLVRERDVQLTFTRYEIECFRNGIAAREFPRFDGSL